MIFNYRSDKDGARTPPFLRSAFAGAVLACCVVMAAQAQRGGGARGGGGGHASAGGHSGFSAPSGAGFRGGFAAPAGAYRGVPMRGAASSRGGYPYAARSGMYARANSAIRPAFYNRAGSGYSSNRAGEGRSPWRNRGYGYGYPGLYNAGLFYNPFFFDPLFGFGDPFWDYGDPAWDSSYVNGPDAGYGDGSYALQQQAFAPQAGPPYPAQPAEGYPPSPDTEPGPWAPQMSRQPSSAPREEAVLTVVYKDGRPPEHVRNYALTRSALLLTGPQMREIPLDEIDVAATERVNRAAGVDFRLPQSY